MRRERRLFFIYFTVFTLVNSTEFGEFQLSARYS